MSNVLITGGAGFIGKRLALALRAHDQRVTVFDSLQPQVHPDPAATRSELIEAGAHFILSDICDSDALTQALIDAKAETVVHLAAETGTGQSYDMPVHYCDVNVIGTARLIEAIRNARSSGVSIRRVLLAGSRAVYGEGAAIDVDGREVTAIPRLTSDLAAREFSPKDTLGRPVTPIPSCGSRTATAPASIYASSKLMQEHILRQAFDGSDVEIGVLRLQNVYGVGQSLHNPYTGVLSIFAKQLRDGKPLNIFEDGKIVRDFVYVSDVVDAFVKLSRVDRLPRQTLDIGSGKGATIVEVACTMMRALGIAEDSYQITGEFRSGDIRHAVADISTAKNALSWSPSVSLDKGIGLLVDWARSQR